MPHAVIDALVLATSREGFRNVCIETAVPDHTHAGTAWRNSVGGTLVLISASGLVRDGSGIGILQRGLYPELERLGLGLTLLPTRDHGGSPAQRARGLAAGMLATPRGDAFLSLVSPLPLRLPVPTLAYVHDVRWQRTRGGAARAYRHADFSRTMRQAARVITISEAAAREIAELDPRNAHKVRVVHSGPGQVDGVNFGPKVSGKMLLIGSDPHKRNELAVQSLLTAMPSWVSAVVGINLSPTVRALVSGHAAEDMFRFRSNLSRADFVQEMGSAEFYLNFGTDEGFGLPYIEALALGCQVVVIDQPLTRELLADAAIYLVNGTVRDLAAQLSETVPIGQDRRRVVAERFSWKSAAQGVMSVLTEVGA